MMAIKNMKSIFLLLLLMMQITSANAESLYNAAAFHPFTNDNKAFRVGDMLTVQIFENSTASSTADTATRRKNNLNTGSTLSSHQPFSVGLTAGGDFDGGGKTQRTNKFLTTLTVSVVEVMPNGDLKLAGEQALTLNDEQQRVILTGRARPDDISDGNVVLSTRLADARITYVGEGDLSDRQRLSWWRKFIDWIGF
jgi:flagellar L-ring protein precursor FlgH